MHFLCYRLRENQKQHSSLYRRKESVSDQIDEYSTPIKLEKQNYRQRIRYILQNRMIKYLSKNRVSPKVIEQTLLFE